MLVRKDLKMMAGRHLWPPSCRAVGAARSLLVGKEPCLPSHHHHHQLDPPPQIGRPPFLGSGSGMMGRGLQAAGRDIGSPSCDNNPTRQSAAPALPVKEPNGHVTSNGGGSPSAGASSTSDGGGFPPAGALSPSDGWGPPSAGASSPYSRPNPCRQRKVANTAAFRGVGMQQREAARLYFQPSPSFPVVEKDGVGVHQVACDGGGSPPASFLVLVSRPDPRLHQQIAAAGSPPSPAGYCSAPARPPRFCGGAVRHTLVSGGFFPSTGIQNAASAKMKAMPRLFCTLPPPVEEVDLMVAEKTWTSGKLCLFDIRRPTADEVEASLELDQATCDQYLDKGRKAFEIMVKPALLSRCLLSRYALSDLKGVQLHQEYHKIISHYPRYMTSLELTENLDTLPAGYRNPFLDHLSEDRAIIIEDWDNRLGASAGATVYDHSVMSMSVSMSDDDDSVVYKGECDASYSKETNTASLCIVIWCRNKVLSCILVEDFKCKFGSVEAEATAMYVLLKEGILLGLHEKPFKACTDSDVVYRVLWGAHRIDHEARSAKLYTLLKFMRSYYKTFIPKHEPREKMMFVDGLMRVKKKDEANQILAVLRKLELDLGGHPIFKFTQKSGVTTGLARKNAPIPLEVERSCYLKVEEKNKIDAAYHIISAMRPTEVIIASRGNQSEEEKLFDLFEDCQIQVEKRGGYSVFAFGLKHRIFHRVSEKFLKIVLDGALSVQECDDDSIFTVFLTGSNGIELELPELSPSSFVSFHQPPKRKGCGAMKESEKHKADGPSFSMPSMDEEDNCK